MTTIDNRFVNSILPTTTDLLILFGATGDLALRMLIPALYSLHEDELLPEEFEIVATARSAFTKDQYRNLITDALSTNYGQVKPGSLTEFLKRIRYLQLDVTDRDSFGRFVAEAGDLRHRHPAIFLSTAPDLFNATILGLQSAGLTGYKSRIGLEKPLGSNLQSSRLINDAVQSAFKESNIYRVDHYLGKETVQNLLVLRFGNNLFEPLWNSGCIEHVQITVSETSGVEDRIEFYDTAGAMRDMVQNHMLQLLALVAMEAPALHDPTAIRDEKVKVLRSLRPIDRKNVAKHVVLGQYAAGAVGGSPVRAYADELGRKSKTETFVALKAHIDNWRWKGVPFYLRTGKRLGSRYSEIIIQFKPVPHSIFGENSGELNANRLVIRLQPEEYVRVSVMAKEPGLDRGGIRLRAAQLDVSLNSDLSGRRRISYERLLLDLIQGDQTLFVRRDEVEAQWQWIDQIRDACTDTETQTRMYMAGSSGPSASIALTERDGISWHE